MSRTRSDQLGFIEKFFTSLMRDDFSSYYLTLEISEAYFDWFIEQYNDYIYDFLQDHQFPEQFFSDNNLQDILKKRVHFYYDISGVDWDSMTFETEKVLNELYYDLDLLAIDVDELKEYCVSLYQEAWGYKHLAKICVTTNQIKMQIRCDVDIDEAKELMENSGTYNYR